MILGCYYVNLINLIGVIGVMEKYLSNRDEVMFF